ncbi:MAG: S41 family peptidase [Bacteroidetes bacterium]|nr:S41 family peptidase [Bacteroidota bacterium]
MDEFKDYQSYKPGEPRRSSNPFAPLIYALLIVFGVLMGFVVAHVTSGKRVPLAKGSGKYDKLDDIISFIKLKYVDTVNTEQLEDNAIEKMLTTLDPHSVYIPKKDLEQTNESLEGNFEGVGIEFFLVQDTITVVSAISGGPSELVGIHAGDRIIKINDTTVAGTKIKNEDVIHKLRGPGGTTVRVSILRSGEKGLKVFNIKRDKIPLFSIDAGYMVDATTGYIKINRFSATTYQEFHKKLKELRDAGMTKLIIDLRQNPGGYLNAATDIADDLLDDEKLIVYTKGKSVDKVEYRSTRPGEFENGKLAVLIDQGSASASEILSGAIQDWDRGTIIGRTSFGKGLVQEQYELPDGSALRLTVARYYTPSGRCIQRAYDKGTEEYYNEISDRYKKGEFVHEDSSMIRDTTVYHTAKGRVVYGGGGIKPDIFVPLDTTEDFDYLYRIRVVIPEFIYSHYSADPSMLNAYKTLPEFGSKYQVPAMLKAEFKAYLNRDSAKLDEKRYAKLAPKVEQLIKAYLAKQKWQTDGFYYVLNQDDKVVEKALEVVRK